LDKQITDATQTLTEAEAKASELKATLADIENQAKSSANITNFLKEVNAEGLQEQLQGELKIIKAVKIDLEELFKIKGASKERLTEMISEFAKAVQEVRDRMAGGLLHAGGELAAEQSLATSKELEASAIEARNNEKAAADNQTNDSGYPSEDELTDSRSEHRGDEDQSPDGTRHDADDHVRKRDR
jgi:hypothetical protein